MGGPITNTTHTLQSLQYTEFAILDCDTLNTTKMIIQTSLSHHYTLQQWWTNGYLPDAPNFKLGELLHNYSLVNSSSLHYVRYTFTARWLRNLPVFLAQRNTFHLIYRLGQVKSVQPTRYG